MTDDRHVDETQPDQTLPLADPLDDDQREPAGFGDLPMQPTGSGVADEQAAFERTELDAGPDTGPDPALDDVVDPDAVSR